MHWHGRFGRKWSYLCLNITDFDVMSQTKPLKERYDTLKIHKIITATI